LTGPDGTDRIAGTGAQFPGQNCRKFLRGDASLALFLQVAGLRKIWGAAKDLGSPPDRLIEGETFQSLEWIQKDERSDWSLEGKKGTEAGDGLVDVFRQERAMR